MTLGHFLMFAVPIWYVCGILNVAGVQAFSPSRDIDFNINNRDTTLGFLYGFGPIITIFWLAYFTASKPIQYGTRLGRFLGRKLEDILE